MLYLKLLKKNSSGEIFNIGSGKPIKIKNLILKICKQIGYGKPKFGIIKFKKKDEIKKLYPNIEKAKSILGWKPKVNINLGLKRTIEYYKNN